VTIAQSTVEPSAEDIGLCRLVQCVDAPGKLVEIADDLTHEARRDLAAERQASTEEAHDVGAAEATDGVLQ
jgi:hypothetical protein